MTKVLCPTCRGSSYVGADDCLTCGGTGTADTSEINRCRRCRRIGRVASDGFCIACRDEKEEETEMSNYPSMSLYAHQNAPWAEQIHHPRCPWNVDSRSDRLIPTHRCDAGHYFNADDVPALEATTNRLTKCPLFHWDEQGYDDGACDAEIRELECACERLTEDPNTP